MKRIIIFAARLNNTLIFKEMTKAELVAEISTKTGIEKTVTLQAVEAAMKVIKNTMTDGENVYLRGFGSFIVKRRAQKLGRIISKNTTIIIPEHKIGRAHV